MSIFSNLHVWLLIAFSIFLLIFLKKIIFHGNNLLKEKINNIQNEINQSEETLAEALSLLNDRKKTLGEATNKIASASLKARNDGDSYYEKISNKLNLQIKNSKEGFSNYLKHKEKTILNEVNNVLIKNSTDEVINILKTNLTSKNHDELINNSIDNIGSFIKKN